MRSESALWTRKQPGEGGRWRVCTLSHILLKDLDIQRLRNNLKPAWKFHRPELLKLKEVPVQGFLCAGLFHRQER